MWYVRRRYQSRIRFKRLSNATNTLKTYRIRRRKDQCETVDSRKLIFAVKAATLSDNHCAEDLRWLWCALVQHLRIRPSGLIHFKWTAGNRNLSGTCTLRSSCHSINGGHTVSLPRSKCPTRLVKSSFSRLGLSQGHFLHRPMHIQQKNHTYFVHTSSGNRTPDLSYLLVQRHHTLHYD